MENLFAFVILHYCAIEDTIRCVDSIQSYIADENIMIIIVDNASPNGTGLLLKRKYDGVSNIHVILNKENEGFARGNNTGYIYAKAQGANFICMTNNDTYLLDDNFCRQAIFDYNKYKYFVLGPNIHVKEDTIQSNPMDDYLLTYSEVRRKIWSLRLQTVLAYSGLLKMAFRIKNKQHPELLESKYSREKYYMNVKLHGSCWIFSPDYVQKYDGINEETFLYLEEEILYITMMKENHLMLYSPNVHIFHTEDAATNYTVGGRKKQIFVIKQHLKSMKVIEKILEGEKEV